MLRKRHGNLINLNVILKNKRIKCFITFAGEGLAIRIRTVRTVS
mgnify:CR=1 FL=1